MSHSVLEASPPPHTASFPAGQAGPGGGRACGHPGSRERKRGTGQGGECPEALPEDAARVFPTVERRPLTLEVAAQTLGPQCPPASQTYKNNSHWFRR